MYSQPHGQARIDNSIMSLKKCCGDFPGGPVVKNLPPNSGDMGLVPGWGTKIPHAAGQLNPRITIREKPACRNYWAHALWTLHATTREALVPQLERSQPQRAHTSQRRPSAARKKCCEDSCTHWWGEGFGYISLPILPPNLGIACPMKREDWTFRDTEIIQRK